MEAGGAPQSLALIGRAAHWNNLAIGGGGGQSGGVVTALGTGRILFSLLGFRTAMDLAGEARRPQRDVPLAMAYMATAARLNWMLSHCRLLPAPLAHINRAGVPSAALIASLAIGLLVLLGGPSWQGVVGFVTAAMVIPLAIGPVSLEALRRQAPQLDRPYRLPWAPLLCPLTFVLASWAIVWCGWTSLRLAVPLVLLSALLFVILRGGRDIELRGSLWWHVYLAGLSLLAWLAPPPAAGGRGGLRPGGVSFGCALPAAGSLSLRHARSGHTPVPRPLSFRALLMLSAVPAGNTGARSPGVNLLSASGVAARSEVVEQGRGDGQRVGGAPRWHVWLNSPVRC